MTAREGARKYDPAEPEAKNAGAGRIFPVPILFSLGLSLSLLLLCQFFPGKTSAQFSALPAPKEITIGFIPLLGPEQTRRKFEPLIAHLEKTLGIKVKIVVPNSYLNLIEALQSNKMEFAYMGPANYVEAARLTGAKAIAVELSVDGKPGYHCIIISSKKSGITSLDQAQGKVFAFTDPDSSSGFLIPNVYFIRERKQTPASFASKTVLAGSHLAAVQGVAKGIYDIAATNDMDFVRSVTALKLSPGQFNILWQSDLVPGVPIVARKDISGKFRDEFLKALFSVSKKDLAKMQMGGFAPAQDSDFDYIRELENFLPKNQPLK